MVNVLAILNDLKTKVDNLGVGDLSDVVKNQVEKIAKFNKLNTKVNKLDQKTLDATTLIHIN